MNLVRLLRVSSFFDFRGMGLHAEVTACLSVNDSCVRKWTKEGNVPTEQTRASLEELGRHIKSLQAECNAQLTSMMPASSDEADFPEEEEEEEEGAEESN